MLLRSESQVSPLLSTNPVDLAKDLDASTVLASGEVDNSSTADRRIDPLHSGNERCGAENQPNPDKLTFPVRIPIPPALDNLHDSLNSSSVLESVEQLKAEAKLICCTSNIESQDFLSNMLQAELLYGRAVLLSRGLATLDATLFANRAMVHMKLSTFFADRTEQALLDAEQSLLIDPRYVKAYHRKALALFMKQRWDSAILIAQQGMILDPQNTVLPDLIHQAQMSQKGWRHVPLPVMGQHLWLSGFFMPAFRT